LASCFYTFTISIIHYLAIGMDGAMTKPFNLFFIMKTFLFAVAILIPLLGFSNHHKTEFKVYGACGMCETRIENAAKSVDGVTTADWNRQTKMLTLEYNADNVNLDDVHKKIAESGHDTDKVRAKDEVYNALPACCHYERASSEKTGQAAGQSSGSCCTR
jgi:periplasmic mercuric ion binding protein